MTKSVSPVNNQDGRDLDREMSNEIEGQTAVDESVHGNGLEARRRIRFSSRTHTTKRSSMVIVSGPIYFVIW